MTGVQTCALPILLSTFAGGRRITEDGKLLVHYGTAVHEPCVLNTMHLKNPISADSFKLHAPEGAKKVKAIVMDTLPFIPFTNRRVWRRAARSLVRASASGCGKISPRC